jgi:hypothetical protein
VDDGAGISGAQTRSAALTRLLPEIGGIEVVDRLSALSGSDFTSVMLEVVARRAARESPASVLRAIAAIGSCGQAVRHGGRSGVPRICCCVACLRTLTC